MLYVIVLLRSSLARRQSERRFLKTAVDTAQMLEGEKYLIYSKARKTWIVASHTQIKKVKGTKAQMLDGNRVPLVF